MQRKTTGSHAVRILTGKVKTLKDKNFLTKAVSWLFIVIFSIEILLGLHDLYLRSRDIEREQLNVAMLKEESARLERQIKEKIQLKVELISDSLAIETAARKLGMSKKGEKIFYFID